MKGRRYPAWQVAEPGTSYSHPDWVFIRDGDKLDQMGHPRLRLVHRLMAVWTPSHGKGQR